MELPPLAWSVMLEDDRLLILDESRLPEDICYLAVQDYHEAARAIAEMKTRAFGQLLTFYYAVILTARAQRGQTPDVVCRAVKEAIQALEMARPTFAFKDFSRQVLCCMAEARPREEETACVLQRLLSLGYTPTLISDNMMAYCLKKKAVEGIFLFEWERKEGFAVCQTGSLLAAIIAQEMNIPCYLFPGLKPPGGRSIGHSFAGSDILTAGANSLIPLEDTVPFRYVRELFDG